MKIKGKGSFSKTAKLLPLILAVLLIMTGCAAKTAVDTLDTGDNITLDAAKEIALADAGVSESDATFTETKTDYENGTQVYELKFYTSNAEYEYEINTADGSVYKKDVDYFGGGNTSGGSETGGAIDLDSAKEIAVTDAGATVDSVTFKEAKKDSDDGVEVYEIEFRYSGKEYEYKIRCSDGAILERDIDD